MVPCGDSGLTPTIWTQLAALTAPIHPQVFVVPTCPYCPLAVRLAHEMALESDMVQADMIEITEFPHLAVTHHVQRVPRTVIDDSVRIEGALPEAELIEPIGEAAATQR